MENRSYISKNGIISFLNRFFLRLRSWPDFVWSLFSPRLAILFDHMYPLSPVHFSLVSSFFFPHLFRFSSSSTTWHFKLQSLHYLVFIFPQNISYYRMLPTLTILSKDSSIHNMSINSSLFFDLIASHHTLLESRCTNILLTIFEHHG